MKYVVIFLRKSKIFNKLSNLKDFCRTYLSTVKFQLIFVVNFKFYELNSKNH